MSASPHLDSHEPILQYSHALNRLLQSYGQYIQSIELYYADDNYLETVTSELQAILDGEDVLHERARQAIEYSLANMPELDHLSNGPISLHPASASKVNRHLQKLKSLDVHTSHGALIGVAGNVYHVRFKR